MTGLTLVSHYFGAKVVVIYRHGGFRALVLATGTPSANMATIPADNPVDGADRTDKHTRNHFARVIIDVDTKAGRAGGYTFIPHAKLTGFILEKLTTRARTTRTTSFGATGILGLLCSSYCLVGLVSFLPFILPFILLMLLARQGQQAEG